ncbi:putative acyl-activating enzyme 19 isoform X2 [Aristolochia californica]|uniref:putative acyl-activating enzyme 19 isoform X2 n=1 Tax=Aristolochia californica TaxID=171875 RepID=UPI0035D694BA
MMDGEDIPRPCCISHSFFEAATKYSDRIAVIDAFGGARVSRESRARFKDTGFNEEELFDGFRLSSFPSVYDGDKSFKYSDILAAVETLSFRIRRILDGCDDSDLIRPQGYFHGNPTTSQQISRSSVGMDEPILTTGTHFALDPKFQNEHISTEASGLTPMPGVPGVVGIYMLPSIEYIVSVLAVLRCGEAFLPLDPLWPKDRILSIISSSKIRLIIKCSHLFDRKAGIQLDESNWLIEHGRSSVLSISMPEKLKDNNDQSELVWPCEGSKQRMFCYVMYTSGSTGEPKGVCGTEEGILNRFCWMQSLFPLHEGEILLFKTSISFIDHLQEFFSALLSGTLLVIPPHDELKENPFCLVDFLKAYGVSRLTTVPSLMRAILPVLRRPSNMRVQKLLQVLILSGEVLHVSLWQSLNQLFPRTSILNLYGSTEVSGDCLYFDCKYLSQILESNTLNSVPIGLPISNCDILLIGDSDMPDVGELYVGGSCISVGYLHYPVHLSSKSSDYLTLNKDSGVPHTPAKDLGPKIYYRTGDLARKLKSGDFVFLGRIDRTIKVNGQRVALEEIESVLRGHPDVVDAAVVAFFRNQGDFTLLVAFLVMSRRDKFCKEHCYHDDRMYACEGLGMAIRNWLVQKLQPVMIPSRYFSLDSLPISTSGKIDYSLLESSTFGLKRSRDEIDSKDNHEILQAIKEAYCDALMVEKMEDDDDFFLMGGNSITAAQVAHRLGINMRQLYVFPSPSKLLHAMLNKKEENINEFEQRKDKISYLELMPVTMVDQLTKVTDEPSKLELKTVNVNNYDSIVISNSLTNDSPKHTRLNAATFCDPCTWSASLNVSMAISYSRCNKLVYEKELEVNDTPFSVKVPRNKNGHIQEEWTVLLDSCVDASPLVVSKENRISLFIGSHSYTFLCIDALSGLVQWEVKLEGRIECSAAVTIDFTQVVVGCYKGKIYFLDFLTGRISWIFEAGGEVKSQPVMDRSRNLVWCGSHDHNLYALDYKNRCCVSTIACGGSIYGSPFVDEVDNMLYVASTSGRVTAVSIKALPFNIAWTYDAGAPIFGSLSMTSTRYSTHFVICCMVDGHVVALTSNGCVEWKIMTGGPIFAGACISIALTCQVLVCSQNGSFYSFESDTGRLLLEYNVGDPITSSAYIDENIQLISDPHGPPERLVCICSSSGKIYLFRVAANGIEKKNHVQEKPMVQEFAKTELPGDIFSSPVMIGGRIFVGCRDDYVHCLRVVF